MLLRAAWVAPVGRPLIRDGFVQVRDGRIVAVDGWRVGPPTDADATDLGDVLLTPGLVNPHTHLELTCYAGRMWPTSLWRWIGRLVRLRLRPGQAEREQDGAVAGAWRALRAGVTCVGDISRRGDTWRALRDVPLRKVCFAELLAIAAAPPRNVEELRAAVAAIPEDQRMSAGLAPHAPYTVPPAMLRATVQLARELGRPWCLHWCETPEEVAFLCGQRRRVPDVRTWWLRLLLGARGLTSPQMPPAELLRTHLNDGPPGLLAHANYATEPEHVAALAAGGHTVVFCPRAHRFYGHPPHPWRALQAAGVPVAIGTDSAASGATLSIIDELKFLLAQTPNPPPAATLLEMATLVGARALGLSDRLGSLTPGKLADLVAFPLPATTNGPTDEADPFDAVIRAAPAPVGVWVGGARVV